MDCSQSNWIDGWIDASKKRIFVTRADQTALLS